MEAREASLAELYGTGRGRGAGDCTRQDGGGGRGINFPYLYERQKSLDWINPVLSEADCLFLVACIWYLRLERDKAAFQWQGIEYDPAMQI